MREGGCGRSVTKRWMRRYKEIPRFSGQERQGLLREGKLTRRDGKGIFVWCDSPLKTATARLQRTRACSTESEGPSRVCKPIHSYSHDGSQMVPRYPRIDPSHQNSVHPAGQKEVTCLRVVEGQSPDSLDCQTSDLHRNLCLCRGEQPVESRDDACRYGIFLEKLAPDVRLIGHTRTISHERKELEPQRAELQTLRTGGRRFRIVLAEVRRVVSEGECEVVRHLVHDRSMSNLGERARGTEPRKQQIIITIDETAVTVLRYRRCRAPPTSSNTASITPLISSLSIGEGKILTILNISTRVSAH